MPSPSPMNDPAGSEETIFTAALQWDTPAQRAAYLKQASAGNPGLRARIEALLQASGEAQTFLERPGPVDDEQLLALNKALDRLATMDLLKAELVKLRYFVGLTTGQAAKVMNVSEPTAKRWWAYAKAWLFREMQAVGPGPLVQP